MGHTKISKIVGREIGIVDGADYEPIFTLKTPSQDGKTALLLEVGADDSHLTLTGSGTSADGLLNGDYIFVPDVRKAVEEKAAVVKAYVVGDELKEIDLKLGDLTDAERQIILDGCLINYYRATK